MTDREFARQSCDDGFKEGVQKMFGVLFQEYVVAKTPTQKKQAVERFQAGLGLCKEAYHSAQQAIDAVFV